MEQDILYLASKMSIEAVAAELDIDVFDVKKKCIENNVDYTTADELHARYELLTHKLEKGGYDEKIVKERNMLSIRIYRERKSEKYLKGLEEKTIDPYLTFSPCY